MLSIQALRLVFVKARILLSGSVRMGLSASMFALPLTVDDTERGCRYVALLEKSSHRGMVTAQSHCL